ncbi:protein HIRA [Centruroides vittatus]|uniref:protein HIRA n=1 Tax=Centruroides vittatus TaxID=120091 RepID=UPI00350EDFE0
MRLLKPSWVSHDGHPIFSVDIHPDGSRFATGGQGADTGRIVIWNMAPVMNEDDEKDENVPKLLCQMDNHLACVNCVRWSGSGKYLASGGDDKTIMIWQTGRYGTGSTVFGSGGKMVNIEQWRCISTLRGHSGDILDLAWSPHDVWLSTCSVDNSIVIWNALKWQEIIAILKGHTGLVKGVSWDPVGKYIASQADDKSLRVWRTHDWQQEAVITEPFSECGGTTHILRLSWSPDGQYLVSAHAMNNSGPTAQIVERDGWKTNKDFVGHRKAITCVRFNPNILSKINKENEKVHHFCCCAIGSRDRSLSVWLTCLKRPLVVIHDLFSNSVLDISWSQTGNQLIVCSWDGTVAYIDFGEEEIGKPISSEEKSFLHQRLYGKSLAMTNHSTATTVIENPEMLKLQEEQKKEMIQKENMANKTNSVIKENGVAKPSEQLSVNRQAVQIKGPIDKQIETRMPDGRRRITPLFIPPAPDVGDIPVPFNSRAPPTFSSSSESKSRIVIEKRDESSGPIINPPQKLSTSQSSPSTSTTTATTTTTTTVVVTVTGSTMTTKTTNQSTLTTPVITMAEVKVYITHFELETQSNFDDNDKYLVATFLDLCFKTSFLGLVQMQREKQKVLLEALKISCDESTSIDDDSSPLHLPTNHRHLQIQVTPIPQEAASTVVQSTNDKFIETERQQKEQSVLKPTSIPVTPVHVPVKRKIETGHTGPGRPPTEKKKPGRPPLSQVQQVSPDRDKVAKAPPQSIIGNNLHLPILKIEKSSTVQVSCGKSDHIATLELENDIPAGNGTSVHRLTFLNNGAHVWQTLLTSRGAAISGSKYLACIVCEDSTLSVFTTMGRRLYSPIILSSSPSRLACNDYFVMVITSRASVSVWDMQHLKVMVKDELLLPIMQGGPTDITICSTCLTVGGAPMITLSTGKSYIFSSEMSSWMLVSDSTDIIQHCSNHQSCMPVQDTSNSTLFPLASLQRQIHRSTKIACTLFRGNPNMQKLGTLSHLDTQLTSSLSLHSPKEYHFWLLTLVRYLTQEGLESRLRDICDMLLGPVIQTAKSAQWDPYILGMNKRDLLREILPVVGSNLRLQRLFTEYKDQLDMITS